MALKPWYKSKTKVGALLIGVAAVLGTMGGMVNGSVGYGPGLQALIAEVGAMYVVFGVRDMPFVNKR